MGADRRGSGPRLGTLLGTVAPMQLTTRLMASPRLSSEKRVECDAQNCLIKASYPPDGVRGIVKEGAQARRAAIQELVERLSCFE